MAVSTTLNNVLDDNEVKSQTSTVTALSLPLPVSTVTMLITIRNETQFLLTAGKNWLQFGNWVGGSEPRDIAAWSQDCIYVSDATKVAGGISYALVIDATATSPTFNVILGWSSDGAAKSGAAEGTDATQGPTYAGSGKANGTTPSVQSANSWTGTNGTTQAQETFSFKIGVDVTKPASPIFTIAQTSSP